MQTEAAGLTQQLGVFYARLIGRLPPCDQQAVAALNQAMRDSAGPAFRTGDEAPDFTLPDQHGKPVCLSDQLRYGPVVLLFVRGGWCPFCTLTLRAYQAALPAIEDAGGSVLAVTPQPSDRCSVMAERDLLAFPTLSDANNRIADKYGVTYELPPATRPLYLRLGHDLPKVNRTGDWRMPLPATFVIGADRRIVLAHLEPALQRRLEPSAAVEALQSLLVHA